MPYKEEVFKAELITLGVFTLPDIVIDSLSWWLPFTGNISVNTIPDTTLRNKTKVVDQMFYIGKDPTNATLGDMRVSYEIIEPGTVSIIAQQSSNTFTAYIAKAGKPVLLVEEGTHSSEEMYQEARDEATALTWTLRVCGAIAVYLGLILMMSPLTTLVDIIPLFGVTIEGMTYCIMIPVALVISVTVVSLAWVAYRPAIAVPLLLVCVGAAYYCWYQKQQKKRELEGVEARGDEALKDLEMKIIDE